MAVKNIVWLGFGDVTQLVTFGFTPVAVPVPPPSPPVSVPSPGTGPDGGFGYRGTLTDYIEWQADQRRFKDRLAKLKERWPVKPEPRQQREWKPRPQRWTEAAGEHSGFTVPRESGTRAEFLPVPLSIWTETAGEHSSFAMLVTTSTEVYFVDIDRLRMLDEMLLLSRW